MQRVPPNEKRGRRHTSTVVVAVVESQSKRAPAFSRDDVRVDLFRASGKGGQNRNKVETAVRLTHLPTGVVVTATEERSQLQNREVAWARLEAKLGQAQEEHAHAKLNEQRAAHFESEATWSWTDWRDEVKTPSGRKASMKRALSGNLEKLLASS